MSRYYDPEIGRFLNADDVTLLSELSRDIGGLNLYAYCLNNPIMFADEYGYASWWQWLIMGVLVLGATIIGVGFTFAGGLIGSMIGGAALGFATGTVSNVISQGRTQGWDNVSFKNAMKAGGIGAGIGALSGVLSFGFGSILKDIGGQLGFALGQMTVSGMKVANVFSSSLLMGAGQVIGKVGGAILGAAVGEYYGNHMFGTTYDLCEDIDDTIAGEIFGFAVDFFKWLDDVI